MEQLPVAKRAAHSLIEWHTATPRQLDNCGPTLNGGTDWSANCLAATMAITSLVNCDESTTRRPQHVPHPTRSIHDMVGNKVKSNSEQ